MLSLISGVNMLRGFLIFLIFICKTSVWKKIEKKYPKFAGIARLPARLVRGSSPRPTNNSPEAETIPMTENNGLKISPKTEAGKFRASSP